MRDMLFSRFFKDRRGGVAPIFAIAIIPVIGLTGAAIDYSRANSVRTGMQAALDATTLAMAKLAPTLTQSELQQKTTDYFNAMFNHAEARNIVLTPAYSTSGGSQLTIAVSGSMDTTFMRVMGYQSLNLGSSSTVKWGNNRLRVALVLDNTGSMASAGKIDALKTATNSLLNQLRTAATTNGDVYVSIIPFVKDVNAGASNYTATWIDWTEWEDEPPYIKTSKPSGWDQVGAGSACPFDYLNHGFGCAPAPGNSSTTSYVPSSGTYSGYICPSIDAGTKVPQNAGSYYNGCYNSALQTATISTGVHASCGSTANCTCAGNGNNTVCTQSYYTHAWIKNARSTWNGCVVDRGDSSGPNSGNYDTNVVAPVPGANPKQYAAQQYAACPQAVMPLSYSWSSMTNLVNSMSPAGNTNQGLGLQLGWMSLVGGGPFPTPPAKDSNYQYQEVIILLTDGLNTQNRWYTSQSSIDARQQMTCNNAKAAGMTLYTIQVNTDGDPTSTLLQNCATDTGKFFLVTSASQIGTIFNQIGSNLSKLRIAR
jgi:Flp pilus assembly protein TadG